MKISFSSSATSGTLSVTASTGCGTSTARTLAIKITPTILKSDSIVAITPPVNPAAIDLTNELTVSPNPSSGPVTFGFRIGENAHVNLEIYSMTGARVARVFEGDVEGGISQTVLYEQYLPTGIYVCVLQYNGKILTTKLAVRHL